MRSSLVALSGGHEIVNELAVHPIWFGVIALTLLLFLLLVAYAFRSVHTRH
jgi:inner membrane protein involved in colicin E2 resistance